MKRSAKIIPAGLLAVALSVLGIRDTAAQTEHAMVIPRVMISPPTLQEWADLFEHPDEWPETRRRIGGLIGADHDLNKVDDEKLRGWFKKLSEWGLELQLAVGAVKEWAPTGAQTFARQQPMWNRFRQLGGPVKSIAMDEPLTAARRFLHQPDSYALEETADFIRLVRQHFPDLKIGDVEPYPFVSVADHVHWIKALQDTLSAQGIRGLDFYRIDPQWVLFEDSSRGSWNEIVNIHHFCRSAGLPMSLIYWASDYPREQKRGKASDQTWYNGLITESSGYSAAGDTPDQYAIESWVGAPSRAVPESDPLSFTGSVLAVTKGYGFQR